MFLPKAYKLIYYLVSRFQGTFRRAPNRTELLKMVYLADLRHYKVYGHQFTEFRYIFYKKGPWTQQFHDLLDYMGTHEINETRRKFEDGKEGNYYAKTSKEPRHDTNLDEDIVAIITNNFFIFTESDLNGILDAVYSEEPMLSAKRNEEIDFTMLPLDARSRRLQRAKKRKIQIERLNKLQNIEDGDDIDLYNEMKPFRAKANELI